MTQPVTGTPSKAKAWAGLAGSLIAMAVPLLLHVAAGLPEPWPAVAGGVVGLLTWLGVYHAPYQQSP